jgi:hypothetical protein
MTTMTHHGAVAVGEGQMCEARLYNGDLVCVAGEHSSNPRGHVYRSSSGSDVDDKHSEGGHG